MGKVLHEQEMIEAKIFDIVTRGISGKRQIIIRKKNKLYAVWIEDNIIHNEYIKLRI